VAVSENEGALGKITVGGVADWRRAGLTEARFRSLVGAGQLVRVRRGAYATSAVVAAAESDPGMRHALDVAAVRAVRGRTGVASHHSAAQMRGLRLLNPPPEGTVTLTVPPGVRAGGYARSGVISHPADLPDGHLTKHYGVPATTAARTVIDIARTSSFMDGVVVADSALYERYTSKTELKRVLAHCKGWPGAARARDVSDFASGLAESVFESCARVVFRERGLPAPRLQAQIFGQAGTAIARVDFLWPEYGVIAEADGLLKYDSGQRAIEELARDRLLREAGYEVIHFTWRELFTDPERVVRRIRDAFNRASRLAGR
jgi:very-short-patch-repair endonuclease/predicted transcriptional regulator of viral defense system